jgi:hypothetical protein
MAVAVAVAARGVGVGVGSSSLRQLPRVISIAIVIMNVAVLLGDMVGSNKAKAGFDFQSETPFLTK